MLMKSTNNGNAYIINGGNEKSILIDGTESMLFLEFCKQFNCSLEISLGVAI